MFSIWSHSQQNHDAVIGRDDLRTATDNGYKAYGLDGAENQHIACVDRVDSRAGLRRLIRMTKTEGADSTLGNTLLARRSEQEELSSKGYSFSGNLEGGYVVVDVRDCPPGMVALFRVFRSAISDHMVATKLDLDRVNNEGWNGYQQLLGYVYPPSSCE